jgi:hypothetical protein
VLLNKSASSRKLSIAKSGTFLKKITLNIGIIIAIEIISKNVLNNKKNVMIK